MDAFVGIQVGAISFLDEGVEATLDRLVNLGAVNAICVSALSWSRGNAGRALGVFPDHGVREPDYLQGGAFFRYDPKYFEATPLRHFGAPDRLYSGFDTLGEVVPAAKRRGVKVYPYYCETAHSNIRPVWQPGFVQVMEIDAFGRRSGRACMRNPAYRAWWMGVVDNWVSEYDIDGVMWGIEREGPMASLVANDDATCFCTFCRDEAHRQGVDAGRAAEGYRVMSLYLQAARRGERPADGYLVQFLRILSQFPEIANWEALWLDGHKSMYRDISGQVKFHSSKLEVGLGIWQMIDTFNPWLKAQHLPSEYVGFADWIKPVLYNVPAGERFRKYLSGLTETILRDATADEWAPVLYRVLGLDEGLFGELARTGFSSDYIRSQTRRYVDALGSRVAVYPGLGIGVEEVERRVEEEDIENMVGSAFDGGARGVMLSRNYSEMRLSNLECVGRVLRGRYGIGSSI